MVTRIDTIPALEFQSDRKWSSEAIIAIVGVLVTVIPMFLFLWRRSESQRLAIIECLRKRASFRTSTPKHRHVLDMLEDSQTLRLPDSEYDAEMGTIQPTEPRSTLRRATTL